MILCFSGTGGARRVARQLAELLRDEVVDLNALLKSGETPPLPSARPYVIAAPVYAWRMPRPVSEFLERVQLTGGRDAYFVLTCGGTTGGAAAHNRALARRKGLVYRGTAGIVMPDNYIVMLPTPGPEAVRRIVAESGPRVRELGEAILRGGDLPDLRGTPGALLRSGPGNVLFYRLAIRLRKFRATDRCVGCGWCARACPSNNIAMEGGRPVWADRCMSCMGCINGCPEGAIEYGKRTVGRPRVYIE